MIAELTRFFRTQHGFLDWYHRIKHCGVEVRIFGVPDLNAQSEGMVLPMLLCQTDALSQWLV